MTAPGRTRHARSGGNRAPPDDPASTLRKILRQEQRRGFNDGTVTGGLDAFLRRALRDSDPGSAMYA
ncbi:MAG: hypothetical protein F4Y94_11190, partial [Chloroflexi bacterium]|nr:hypothetical protein [Chloroflexota bacterium]